jgi:hypothetical protein
VGYKYWGECRCPAPEWLYDNPGNPSNMVRKNGNVSIPEYADECEAYELKNEEKNA